MNRLGADERAHILDAIRQGRSRREIALDMGVGKHTVARLAEAVGKAIERHHNESAIELPCRKVEIVPLGKHYPIGGVEMWTLAAVDVHSLFVVSMACGRLGNAAARLVQNVDERLSAPLELRAFRSAPEIGFRICRPGEARHYLEALGAGASQIAGLGRIFGPPDDSPMRPSNPFLWLFAGINNFELVDASGRTPAMKVGVADKPWRSTDFVELADRMAPRVKRPSRYRTGRFVASLSEALD